MAPEVFEIYYIGRDINYEPEDEVSFETLDIWGLFSTYALARDAFARSGLNPDDGWAVSPWSVNYRFVSTLNKKA